MNTLTITDPDSFQTEDNAVNKQGGIGFLLLITLFSWAVFGALAYALGLL